MRYRPFLRALMVLSFMSLAIAGAFTQDMAGPYVIRGVDFQVQGRTLAFVLKQKIEANGPVVGKTFKEKAALEAYIEDRRQLLSNNRLLASVAATYDVLPRFPEGSFVDLQFAVVDTWNIVVLPEPKYDSNKGLTLYLKGRDYNFMGSMQTLNLDLSFVSDTVENKSFELATSFTLPFQSMGAVWSLGISEDFQTWTDGTLRSGSTASLTYNVPSIPFPASVASTQGFYYNPDVFQTQVVGSDILYLGESLAFAASIPLGFSLGALGPVYYGPSLSLTQNWWPGVQLQVYGRPGLGLGFTNSLSSGRVDWIGNMRDGVSTQVSSSNGYTFLYQDFVWDLSGSLSAYANWRQLIGVSARLSAQARVAGHFPADDLINLGANLRGILDYRITGVGGVSANLSIPMKLFDFPMHSLIKKNWLDFEVQAQPFVDAAIMLPSWQEQPSQDWFWNSAGLEVLVFPVVMRSFIVRASIGWDLVSVVETLNLKTKAPRDGAYPYEIYFGTGLAY